MPDPKKVVIYHAPCSDGFAAAWAAWVHLGDKAEYVPGIHAKGKEDEAYWLELVKDKDVLVFDFSFPRKLTEKLYEAAASFRVIDHHISAKKELDGLDYCEISLDNSGAVLAWKHFATPDTPLVPELLKYVQDQDLWEYALPGSHAANSYINAQPFDFQVWTEMDKTFSEEYTLKRAIRIGKAMLDKQQALVDEIAQHAEIWDIEGACVLAVNCPSVLRAFVCDTLGQMGKYPFVAAYEINDGKVTWSLRSNWGTAKVNEVAALFTGGGHAVAAGFTIPVSQVNFRTRTLKKRNKFWQWFRKKAGLDAE